MNAIVRLIFLLAIFINVKADMLPRYDGVFNPDSKKDRVKYANQLIDAVVNIKNNIASLSPNEEKWVKSELEKYDKTKNVENFFKLLASREYNILEVTNFLNEEIRLLELIKSVKHIEDEIFLWSTLIINHNDPAAWECMYSLHAKGYIPKDLFSKYELTNYILYFNNAIYLTIDIQEKIINEYLFKKTKTIKRE